MPRRAKARRSASWTSAAPTRAQVPRGESHGREDRATALIGHPQPTGLTLHQGQMLAGVHLPDVVRRLGADVNAPRGATGRGRTQASPVGPALQGAGGGDLVPHAAELDAEEFGPPSGVLAAEVQGRVVDGLPLRRPCRRLGAVGGGDRGLIARTEAGDEGPDGTHGEAELDGDAGRGLPIAPSVAKREADGEGDRARHGSAPAGVVIESHQHHHNPLPAAAEPDVAISGETPRRVTRSEAHQDSPVHRGGPPAAARPPTHPTTPTRTPFENRAGPWDARAIVATGTVGRLRRRIPAASRRQPPMSGQSDSGRPTAGSPCGGRRSARPSSATHRRPPATGPT
jgi:hypothetical protein